MKKLKEKLIDLQKRGFESVLISDVLMWIRNFESTHSDNWWRRKELEEREKRAKQITNQPNKIYEQRNKI